jgi:hypothetical protein
MSDEFNIKDQHISFPQSILTRYVSNLAKVIDKFRTIDRSFKSEVLDSGIRFNTFNMVVDEYKFDIFTPTYKVKLHYAVMDISYVYNYEDGHIINMRITPSSWDCINIVSYLCALRGFTAFLRNILEGDTEDDFKTVDNDCINVVTKDEILYLRSTQNENEDTRLSKKIYNMIYSLLNDELSIRKNIRGVDYEDGVYTIRTMIDHHVLFYYKHINLLYSRSTTSSELYGILERIDEV